MKPAETAHAYQFINILVNKIVTRKSDFEDYHFYTSEYFRRYFGGGAYSQWLNKLKTEGIVQAKKIVTGTGELKDFFSITGKIAKCYRINPDLCTSEFKTVSYFGMYPSNEKKTIKILDEEWSIDFLLEDFEMLNIPVIKLKEVSDNIISEIRGGNFQINEQVTEFFIPEIISDYDNYTGISTAKICLEKAAKYGTDFIKDGSKFYLRNIDTFLVKKKKNIAFSNLYAIEKLRTQDFFMKRFGRSKNARLSHNFTSIKGELLQCIMEENGLTELDISNSQFAFLAAVMDEDTNFKNNTDFLVFKKHAGSGTLYQFISEQICKTIPEVKLIMMEVSFSSHKHNPNNKKLLRKIFPSVIAFMDDYKKKAVKSSLFSIMLQNFEAEVMIDRIYAHLKREGFFCITKHDSLIVRKTEAEYILNHVTELFNEAGFHCNLRINNKKNVCARYPLAWMKRPPVNGKMEWIEFEKKHYSFFTTPIGLKKEYAKYLKSSE